MADFASIAPLLEDNRDLVVDALRRDQERRQKLALRASGEPDTDPTAIVALLNQSAKLDLIVRALAAQVPEPAMMSPAQLETAVLTRGGAVANVIPKIQDQMTSPAPTAIEADEDDEDAPTKAWILAPDAIAALIGEDAEPLPEDARSPSGDQSAVHGDEFGDGWPSTAQ